MSKLDQYRLMTPAEKDVVYGEILANCDLVADCWVYRTVNSAGYGMKYIAGKMRPTSRFVYAYHTRESLNIKMDACHIAECPNKACCNPRHLFWGTHKENCEHREAERKKQQWDSTWSKDPVLGHITHEKWKGVDSTLHEVLVGSGH